MAPTLLLIGGGHTHIICLRELFRIKNSNQLQIDIILISDRDIAVYSGILPGTVAIQYSPADAVISLCALCDILGVVFIRGRVIKIHKQLQIVKYVLTNPQGVSQIEVVDVHYDVVSIDIGSSVGGGDILGISEYAIPTRPIGNFISRLYDKEQNIENKCRKNGNKIRIVVVGGGAAGIELSLCLHSRYIRQGYDHILISLIGPNSALLTADSGNPTSLSHHLVIRGIQIISNLMARSISASSDGSSSVIVCFDDNSSLESDIVIWSTGAACHAESRLWGVTTDSQGWMSVDDTLRSVDNSRMFGAGDCISINSYPWVPKAGVYAVREASILTSNLITTITSSSNPLLSYKPQRGFLSLLNAGNGSALVLWKNQCLSASWAFKLKDYLDRQFLYLFHSLILSNHIKDVLEDENGEYAETIDDYSWEIDIDPSIHEDACPVLYDSSVYEMTPTFNCLSTPSISIHIFKQRFVTVHGLVYILQAIKNAPWSCHELIISHCGYNFQRGLEAVQVYHVMELSSSFIRPERVTTLLCDILHMQGTQCVLRHIDISGTVCISLEYMTLVLNAWNDNSCVNDLCITVSPMPCHQVLRLLQTAAEHVSDRRRLLLELSITYDNMNCIFEEIYRTIVETALKLQYISIRDITLSSMPSKYLIKYLTVLTDLCSNSLKGISFEGCCIDDNVVPVIRRLLHQCHELIRIDLAGSIVSSSAFLTVGNLVKQWLQMGHGRYADLSWNTVEFLKNTDINERISDVLTMDPTTCDNNSFMLLNGLQFISNRNKELDNPLSYCIPTNVHTLSLYGTPLLPNDSFDLKDIIRPHISFLRVLDLTLTQIGDPGAMSIAMLISDMICLKSLHLSNCDISSNGIMQIIKALNSNNRKLSSLYLRDNIRLNYRAARAIASLITNLHELDISGTSIGCKGLIILATTASCPSYMSLLNLRNCGLDGTTIASFVTKLQFPNLRNLAINSNPIRDEGIILIVDALRHRNFCSLSCLDISACEFTHVGAIHLANVLLAAASDSTTVGLASLKQLVCVGNPIGSLCGHIFADWLVVNRKVSHLYLGRCSLGDDGVIPLFNSLFNSSLSSLHLWENLISDRGISVLIEVLDRHGSLNVIRERRMFLNEVNISGNDVSYCIRKKLRSFMETSDPYADVINIVT